MSKLKYKSRYSTNYILIIDALPDGELQTGKTLEENLRDFFTSRKELFPCRRLKISDISFFITIFEGLTHRCQNGTQPLIHIEAHGDKTKGLKIGGEYLAWSELIKLVAPLNVLTENNCGLILASCFGAEIFKLLPINKPCPFNFIIAPSAEVKAGEIRDEMTNFYKELMSSGDFNLALAHIGQSFVFFESRGYFLDNAFKYFTNQLAGRPAKALKEKLITDVRRGFQNAETDIKLVREEARRIIFDPEEIYTLHAKTFLHGEIPVPYKDFEIVVSAMKCRS